MHVQNCIRTQNFATLLLAGRQTQDKQHTKFPKHVPAAPSMQHVCTLTPFTCMQAYGIHARARTRHQMNVQFGNLGAVVLCAMVQWLNVYTLPIFLKLSTWQLCAMTRRCMQCMHVHMCKLQRPSKPSIRHLATSPCIGMYHTYIWLDRFRCAHCSWFSFCVVITNLFEQFLQCMHQVALLCFSLEVCHGSLKRLLQLLFIFLMLVAWCWGGDRWISNDDKSAFACNE